MNERPLYGFFGHHKGATTWTVRIIRQACDYLGLRVVVVPNDRVFSQDLKGYVAANETDFLCYVNADFEYVRPLDRLRGFHVVRDPRDIVVSSYFSHLHSHPTTSTWPGLAERRAQLRTLSKDEGLCYEIQASQWEFEHLRKWDYSNPDILEIKMEQLTQNAHQEFAHIFRFLGLLDEDGFSTTAQVMDNMRLAVNRVHRRTRGLTRLRLRGSGISPATLTQIVDENTFSKLAGGRRKGEEDVQSHYRKGVPGDWQNHFEPVHKALFKERYNDVLLRLGYEDSADW